LREAEGEVERERGKGKATKLIFQGVGVYTGIRFVIFPLEARFQFTKSIEGPV
jgi:hypothetical protein